MNTLSLNAPTFPTGTADSQHFTLEDVGGHQIRFRRYDSFGSLTDLCKIYGRQAANFLKLPTTQKFASELARSEKLPLQKVISSHSSGLNRGTWVHPFLLIEAARWCDIGFGIACNKVVLKVLSSQGQLLANGDVTLPMNTQALEKSLEPTNHQSDFIVVGQILDASALGKEFERVIRQNVCALNKSVFIKARTMLV